MSKKNITIYMNCHGYEIQRHLLMSDEFKSKYNNPEVIITFNRINNGGLTEQDKKILSETDILIYNPVSEEHKEMSYQEIIKQIKPINKTICIPYYRFYGYWYNKDGLEKIHNKYFDQGLQKELIPELKKYKLEELNQEVIDNIIDNVYGNKKEEIKLYCDRSLEDFKRLDNISTIRMYDFVKTYYKEKQLFYNYCHPTPVFFRHLTQQLFKHLELKNPKEVRKTNMGLSSHQFPIYKPICDSLELKFDNWNIMLQKTKITYFRFIKIIYAMTQMQEYKNTHIDNILNIIK